MSSLSLTYHKGIGMCISINVCTSNVAALFHLTHMPEETKNTWARDDPAILILIAGGMLGESPTPHCRISTLKMIVGAAIAWSVVWSYGLYDAIRLVFLMVFRDFLLVGVISATVLW
jgi:UNC-50 family